MPELPPGPNLPALAQGPLFARDPVGVLRRCRARYGPVFTLRFPTTGPTVVVGDAAAVPALTRADPGQARAGEARRTVLPQASPRSSFGADGDGHAVARGRIRPALAGDRIEAVGGEIRSIAARHVASWPSGAPLRLLSRMRTLCEEVFVRVALGVADPERAAAITAAVGRLLRTPGNPPLLPPDRDQPGGGLLDAVFRARVAPLASLLSEEIESCRRGQGCREDGILAHALSGDPDLPAERLVDELIVVLAAAQEPPSIALTWIVERLSRDRALGQSYLAAPPGSPWRTAIADEVLRLRHPALASLRKLTAPQTVDGHHLPAGTVVMISIPLIHRDPDVFEDPEGFRPERFGGTERPAAFIPFGDGVRGCPGEDLARAEIAAVVPMVFERLILRFPPRRERPVQRATVLVPSRSGLAFAGPR